MRQNVIPIRATPQVIGHYVYLGQAHRKLANLLVSDGIRIERAVVDAAHAVEQKELLVSLKQSDVQLVLDTRSMELGTPGGCTKPRRQLPWAALDGHWTPDTLGRPEALSEYCHQIAEFAVANGVDVVLAPTHLHVAGFDEWLRIDARACELLRRALDRCGGQSIAIDWPLAAMVSVVENPSARQEFKKTIADQPVDNLWIRTHGFGTQAGAARTYKLISVFGDLATASKPIILDCAGGLAALTLAAFGVAGGVAHGIANQNEQFNSYPLRKPRDDTGGGGGAWVYLPMIDKYIKASKLGDLFALRGVTPHLICNDNSCCPHGTSNMKSNAKRHALYQRVAQIKGLQAVPEHQRPAYLLRELIQPAGRTCRALERLPAVEEAKEFYRIVRQQSHRLDDLEHMTSELSSRRSELNRSRQPKIHFSNILPTASGY